MKKVFFFLLSSIVGLTVVLAFVGTFYLGSVIKSTAQYMVPPMTLTKFELKDVNISLLGGKVSLMGMVLGNPPGYTGEKALAFDKIFVEIDLYSLFTDKVHIREVSIEGLEVIYAQKFSGKSNIQQIGKNLEIFVNGSKKPSKGIPESKASEKKVQIDHIMLSGGTVRLEMAEQNKLAVTTALPVIELRDIGKGEEGATTAEAMNTAAQQILSAIDAVVLSHPELFNKGAEGMIEKASIKVKEGTQSVIDNVKGFFKKD